jgi:predicted transposase YbfD/YdcC
MKIYQSLDQTPTTVAKATNHTAKLPKQSQLGSDILARLLEFASSVPDFRRQSKGNYRHKLSDIIILMVFARASKCVSRADIIGYGNQNLEKFRKMSMFKNGIPSEPTICRIECGINEHALADQMQVFAESFNRELLENLWSIEIICVDGKAERGTIQENGRNPDIVSAYSFNTGITLATEACQEKSNEIKAVPLLIDKIDIQGKVVTADAMSMQKEIIDKIREKGGDFLIELKANQHSLRYGVEDKLKKLTPVYSYTDGPELGHGRIETRTYRMFDGTEAIVDKEKWGGNLTIVEYESDTTKKSTGAHTYEKRIYLSSLPTSTPKMGSLIRNHWSIESMHWCLDTNLLQDKVKRKSAKAARNLDTIQRIVHSLFSIWRGLRKKRSDKTRGMAELMRCVSLSFTKLLRFLHQKCK